MKSNFTSFLKFSLIAFSMAGLVLITGCSDDDPEVNPLVGKYQLTNATLADGLTITLVQEPAECLNDPQPQTLPAGFDMTAVIATILASASPCEDPTKAAIELAEGGVFYYLCVGEDEDRVSSGEWTSDETTISLTINSETLDQVLPITVSDYTISGTSFSGTISNFPVPINPCVPFGGDLDPDTEGLQANFQFAAINATFTKLP
jgi:hypothetical protein